MGDEEAVEIGMGGMGPAPGTAAPQGQQAVKTFAFFMLGEFLVFLGLFMLMLGLARALDGLLGFDGAGEGILGACLLGAGYLVIWRSRPKQMIITAGGLPRASAQQPPAPEPAGGSYR